MLSVLLLAVAQQNPSNVRWLDSKSQTRYSIADEAMIFVDTLAFDMMCKSINVQPEMLRELDPDTALRLFTTLLSDKQDKHEFD